MKTLSRLWHSLICGCHRENHQHLWKGWVRCLLPLMTAVSLAWFLVRVIPKPIRATYPCQQAAFPIASACVLWLLGLHRALMQILKLHRKRVRAVLFPACFFLVTAMAVWAIGPKLSSVVSLWKEPTPASGWHPVDPPNSPIGVAQGIHPGRVVWAHDPSATSWDGSTNFFFSDRFTSLSVVESMLSSTIQKLTEAPDDATAWDSIFKYYNQTHGRNAQGYSQGEMIAIKINCNNTSADGGQWFHGNRIDATPQTVKALLRQLVNVARVPQTNIIVYDAQRIVYFVSTYCSNEFPQVQYKDYNSTKFVPGAITFATNAVIVASSAIPDYLVSATYGINLALLKRHCSFTAAGDWTGSQGVTSITCCFKNHFGSSRSPGGMHSMIRDWYNGMGSYNALVDLEGSRHLSGKTILYLIDGLYAANWAGGTPIKWNMAPFNTNWPASLFASQDIVAIDSVALDFLRSEWNLMPSADNFLHEAALADNPPSHTLYAPDGERLKSLGVHEHWNSSKQYSRNIDKNGTGIELISVHSDPGIAVALATPLNRAVVPPSSSLVLTATAVSSYTGIRRVDFYRSGVLIGSGTNSPYTCTWQQPPPGDWELTAVATDSDGRTATSTVVNVTVKASDLAVRITSPLGGATIIEGQSLAIQADVTSSDNPLQKVDFYANGSWVGASSNSASFSWSNPTPGQWKLHALAWDSENHCVSSDPITVTVRPSKIATAGTLYVDLRATNVCVQTGVWTNWGTLGDFVSYGPGARTYTVVGIPSATFGGRYFFGPNTVPELEGSSPRSVELWAFQEWLYYNYREAMISWGSPSLSAPSAFAVNFSFVLCATHGLDVYNLGWGPAKAPYYGRWHHIVYTYDGATLCRVYVDGKLQVEQSLPGPLQTTPNSPIILGGASSLLYTAPDALSSFGSCLSSVRVHGGVLTAEQVATNFAVGPGQLLPVPTIRNATLSQEMLMLTLDTFRGFKYGVEFSESLSPPAWTTVTNFQAAQDSTLTVPMPSITNRQGYYRAVILPWSPEPMPSP